MAKVGRPTKYSAELANVICERLASGEPMTKICRDDQMPSFRTVWAWEKENEEFLQLSLRAREHGTHYLTGECIEIADDPGIDPADKRIRIDTRIRLAGKWNSKVYGDKQLVGSDPENPLPDGFKVTLHQAKDAR